MTVSRRTVVQGTAWSIPAVTIAAASVSGTASNTARSPESRATIDRAFPDLLTKQGSLTVNFYQLVLSANGLVGESWLNLRNDSDVPLRFTADHPLAPRVDVVGRTGPKDTERAGTWPSTSWGTITRGGFDKTTGTRTYTWTFVGTVPACGKGDNESDF